MSIRIPAFSLLAVVALVAATALTAPSSSATEKPRSPGLVRVETGWLRGQVSDDQVRYTSVPYAAAPVGDRRWQPPRRAERWHGVRDATIASPYCPQFGPGERLVGQEDCLYLDVTVPADTRPGERLPVLVWLHGGNFSAGGAREFDGRQLATQGRMMVVTLNYRLGALGFLAAPDLEHRGGNFGLMDQAAALRWVHRNASGFGGNPTNVTLAGHSAGGRAVCSHLASPLTRGLFDRAITASGACDNEVPTLQAAHGWGAQATEELGCATAAKASASTDVAACLRSRPVSEVLGVLTDLPFSWAGRVADRPWNPIAGTPVLPEQPGVAIRNGSAAHVPLLIGSTRDEMAGFVSNAAGLPVGQYHDLVEQTFGQDATAVLREYPANSFASPAHALSSVLTDWGGSIGACPVLRTAQDGAAHQPVYLYEFAEDSGQVRDGFAMGSYHGLDLKYLWAYSPPPEWDQYPALTAAQRRLGATMIDYWAAFARNGDPNGPGRPTWPRLDATGLDASGLGATASALGLSTSGISPVPYGATHRCEFWSGVTR